MSEVTRKDFLKVGAASAAAGAVATYVRPAGAQPLAPSKLDDIDRFVILMQENRSFDHYFGMLRGVRGYGDPAAHRLANGRSVFYQPDAKNPDGYVLPFRLDTKTTSAQKLHDLSHAWDAQHESLSDGAMDGFVLAHRQKNGSSGPLTMGYYTRDDLPFYYALADAFTICDGYHCSVLGPTYPNRVYWMSATIDPDGKGGGPVLDNSAFGGKRVYDWETYVESLERKGVSWQVYFDVVDDYALNVLRYFKPFQNPDVPSPLKTKALRGYAFSTFLENLRSGNLPQVTFVLAHADQCEHPSYLPAKGENYTHQLLQALWENPKAWERTAFILTYDENDGLFDHVVPPVPPPGTPGEFVQGRPVGLGFRVPCLVISPFSRGGYVCSDTFDHTSILRLLEARFGAEVPNLSAWRRETCGDLTTAFGFGEPPRYDVPDLPETARAMAVAEEAVTKLPKPTVPATQSMPVQEPGTRPRRGSPPPV